MESTQERDLGPYLAPTWYIDCDSDEILDYSVEAARDSESAVEKAVKLFYAVRDDIIYDPYSFEMRPESMKASEILKKGTGYCVAKAVVLTAAARAVGIPARLGFADVKNHLSTKRLTESMGTDVFVYHGYSELYLNGKWVKATPTFNRSLCDKFGVKPLEFDGLSDSLFHPYDAAGRAHMEYLTDYGHYADLPLDEILEASLKAYPEMFRKLGTPQETSFEEEAEKEFAGR